MSEEKEVRSEKIVTSNAHRPLTPHSSPVTLFICGPTASGKSDLAMRAAKAFDGEIICADSQTVRRGMDIGTAKPTKNDQAIIHHHLLDIIDPYDRFTVSDFKTRAEQSIQDVVSRGKLPIIVGGTGLYIDALLYNFSFRRTSSKYSRSELEAMSVTKLQEVIQDSNYIMPQNNENPRHLIRAIESEGQTPEKESLRDGAIVVGIDPGREELEARIKVRVDSMLESGLFDEFDELVEKYGSPVGGFDAVEYRIIHENPDAPIEEIKEKILIGDRQYAKKQRSWLRRNKDIEWFDDPNNAFEHLQQLL